MSRVKIDFGRGGVKRSTVAALSLTSPKTNALLLFNDLAASEEGLEVGAKYHVYYDDDNHKVEMIPAEAGEGGVATLNRRVFPPSDERIAQQEAVVQEASEVLLIAEEGGSAGEIAEARKNLEVARALADKLQGQVDNFDWASPCAVYFPAKSVLAAGGLHYSAGFDTPYEVGDEGTITFHLPNSR